MSKRTVKNGLKSGELFDIPLFGRDGKRLLKWVDQIEQKQPIFIATVNPEFLINALKDEKFYDLLKTKTTVNVIDGIGVIWGLRVCDPNLKFKIYNLKFEKIKRLLVGFKTGVEILKGWHREELISGADLIEDVCRGSGKVFFLGGWGQRAELSARKFKIQNSKLKIEWSKGRPEETDEEVINKINAFRPDWLFVAYGMKKQEEWIAEHLSELKTKVVVGVGRSFDYHSGELKRAPGWVRKMGMEWLFSLLMEPKRWRRQLSLCKFIWLVIFK